MIYLIIALFVISVIIVFIFNRLIRYKTLMREAWSGIDVQLKRRHDLIPNIMEAVKGYMQHERNLFEQVASLRSRIASSATVKEKNETENTLSSALKTVFALAENYPELKANQSFLKLQTSLSETEDQIQLARRYYNGTVRNYNILAESFPSNLVAGVFGFKPAGFFEIEYATERQTPDIKF